MITVTVIEAFSFLPVLKKVMAMKLPVKAAYRLSRFAMKLQPDLQKFEEKRVELIKELGVEVEGRPGTYEIEGAENLAKYREQVEAMGSEEIKIDLDPITVDMLGDAELAAADLVALEKLIA